MGSTKIVNIYKDNYDVYIGRAGKNKDGYFGNPFPLKKGEVRGSTIEKYKEYFYRRLKEDNEFKNKILSLKGKILGCFCKPNSCHGDIIKEYLDKPFKILVCGSRDIKNQEFVFKTLDFLTSKRDLSEIEIIHGNQKSFDKHLEIYYGADYFAKLWAVLKEVKQTPFPADWDQFGKAAGPIRNKQMANEKPDACVAFLGINSKNVGTLGMLKLVKDKGIPIKEYYI